MLSDLVSRQITIPWGREERLTLEIPSEWPTEVADPDLDGALADYGKALTIALDVPVESTRVEDQVSTGSKVAIVVDDPSRWTPVQAALPLLLTRLRNVGVRQEDISISIGVGRHHAVDNTALRNRVGSEVVDQYRCYSPPVDDITAYSDLGKSADGIPVRVFKPVAEADLRILIGSVLPHMQAGFGGGYKLIFPGTSHRSTLSALHSMGLGSDTGKLLGGDLATNPMRKAIRAAAEKLGPCFSISHILGAPGQIFTVLAGSVDAVQSRLSAEAARRFRATSNRPADILVAGNHPWPGDPMQSFKVLLQHRAVVRPGGVQVGFFWTDPVEIDRSFPLGAMRAIAASGSAGGWGIRRGLTVADRAAAAMKLKSEFMIRWARELVVDRSVLVYAPLLYEKIGPRLGPVRIFNDQTKLWNAVRDELGVIAGPPLAKIFPQGGLTYCSQ